MADAARTRRLLFFALGFLAATGVEAVRAGDCEGGPHAMGSPERIEAVKRPDLCNAAPTKTTQRLETGALGPQSASPSNLLPSAIVEETEPQARTGAGSKAASAEPSRKATREKLPLPRTAEGTDFRNVVLLNPEPGQSAIYRHEY
jgi:hypothetical protein